MPTSTTTSKSHDIELPVHEDENGVSYSGMNTPQTIAPELRSGSSFTSSYNNNAYYHSSTSHDPATPQNAVELSVVDDPSSIGWFHGKIQVDKKIYWANNLKLQIGMAIIALTALVLTIVLGREERSSESVSVGLISGSLLSIITCTLVIYTYIKQVSWRKHPNPFIFYRSVCDLSFVLVLLIIELRKCIFGDKGCGSPLVGTGCTIAAGFTQFFLFASESFFFVMAVDLYQSLRSPFTDYRRNKKRYHWFVWGTSLITLIVIVSVPGAAGPSEFGYCWTQQKVELQTDENAIESSNSDFWDLNTRSWLFFYIWLLFYWAYAITIIIFAWKRLQAGLNETLRMRLRVLHSVTLYVITIIIYWAVAFSVYTAYQILEVPTECGEKVNCGDLQVLNQLMSFMITCKGYFDFIVWFQINEWTYSDGFFKSSSSSRSNNHSNNRLGGGDNVTGKKNENDIDVDLNPQVNLALRCEVLYYTTTGIIQAVKDTHHLPPGATQQALYLQPQGMANSISTSSYPRPSIESSATDSSHHHRGTLFIDYCPHTFSTIRRHFGIETSEYIESLSKTTKERLSEGASGAFMFFSHDQKLIVKSMSQEETSFLRSIAADYAAYLLTHPDSFLTRFYGCHSIKLYGSTFSFVVMENLFSTSNVIHRRYDIKGSWVNRTARHPSSGKRVTCRHCNGVFVFGSTDNNMSCPLRVGSHEPNIVLKDNDLTAKVRLDRDTAEAVYHQLVTDASFLSRLGIMDYSLLMGVHNIEYVVEDDNATLDVGSSTSSTSTTVRRRSSISSRNNSIIRATAVSNASSHQRTNSSNSIENSEQVSGLPRLYTGTRKANSVVGPSCYYFGMIDILQTWSLAKRSERFTKVHLLRQDADGISAVPPTAYKDRFTLKIADIFGISLHDEDRRSGSRNTGDDENGACHYRDTSDVNNETMMTTASSTAPYGQRFV